MALVATLFVATFIFTLCYSLESEYRLLFRDLEAEDASQVVEWLRQEKLSYRLQQEGRTILVPAERMHEIRLQLAGKGLPKNKVAGFELFDQNHFGATEFVQQLNYTRALQGELSRTIGHLQGIEQATVHIARPKPSIFQQKKQATTASVVLHVKRGYNFSPNQIYGITYLVASAVEGLSSDDITIVDQHGQLLWQKQGGGTTPAIHPALDLQRNVEEHLRQKAQSMLDQVLGRDRAIVRVNAELDMQQSKEVHETYNPENQTPMQETVRTHKSSESLPEGATSSTAKVKKTGAGNGKQKDEQEENREVRYALDKTVKEIETKSGSVRRIALALVLDHSLASHGENIGKLVQEAIGIDKKRGDTYQLITIPFQQEEKPVAEPVLWWQPYYPLLTLAGRFIPPGIALVLLGVVLLRLLKKNTQPTIAQMPGALTQEAIAKLPETDSLTSTVRQVRQAAKESPHEMASLLHKWFHEETKGSA